MKLLSRISAFLPLALTLVWLHFLPDRIPLHFNLSGDIDRWGSKWESLLIPGIVLVLGITFHIVQKHAQENAQREDNYKDVDEKLRVQALSHVKTMQVVMVTIGLFFTVLQAVLLYGAGRAVDTGSAESGMNQNQIVAICMGIMLIILGNYMPKTRKNSTIGLRCGWTMYNEVTWQKSNRFAGLMLILAGLASVVCAILLPVSWAMPSLLVLLGISLVVSLVYAAKVYRQETEEA
jgi:uncharacterized membrane protein